MKNLFELESLNEILDRLNKLKSTAQRQWGKMDVAQMCAHCSSTMQLAKGERVAKRLFIGRLLSPFLKQNYYNEKPFAKGSPTSKESIIADERDFEKEKTQLMAHIRQFAEGGEKKCTTYPHPFFGTMTPQQWAIGMYKHLDHHLRQFNG